MVSGHRRIRHRRRPPSEGFYTNPILVPRGPAYGILPPVSEERALESPFSGIPSRRHYSPPPDFRGELIARGKKIVPSPMIDTPREGKRLLDFSPSPVPRRPERRHVRPTTSPEMSFSFQRKKSVFDPDSGIAVQDLASDEYNLEVAMTRKGRLTQSQDGMRTRIDGDKPYRKVEQSEDFFCSKSCAFSSNMNIRRKYGKHADDFISLPGSVSSQSFFERSYEYRHQRQEEENLRREVSIDLDTFDRRIGLIPNSS